MRANMKAGSVLRRHDFPARLRAAREELGWTQTKMARELGVHPSQVSHMESGRRAPSTAYLVRLVWCAPEGKRETIVKGLYL